MHTCTCTRGCVDTRCVDTRTRGARVVHIRPPRPKTLILVEPHRLNQDHRPKHPPPPPHPPPRGHANGGSRRKTITGMTSAPPSGVGAFHSAQGAPPSVREKQGGIRGRGGARRGRSTTAGGRMPPAPLGRSHACERPIYKKTARHAPSHWWLRLEELASSTPARPPPTTLSIVQLHHLDQDQRPDARLLPGTPPHAGSQTEASAKERVGHAPLPLGLEELVSSTPAPLPAQTSYPRGTTSS